MTSQVIRSTDAGGIRVSPCVPVDNFCARFLRRATVTRVNLPRPVFSSALWLAFVSAALVGCSPTPVPTPTPTPAFASEEEAFAAAEETYRAYIDAFNAIDLQDTSTFDPALDFTTGDYERREREDLSVMHAEQYIRGGDVEIVGFRGVALTKADTVRARTCDDVSSTTFTDSDGVSLVPPDRPNVFALDRGAG